ncbi:NAD-dependent epimerase/dehydratase family protein [Capnocytophaga leadbetteri]|uniref:NAD-dependent epimerase/dehydratase family protein n=1 Tax=Capnocytophaga leadbetteri TaxID=327575 RepID=UPI0028E42CEC|nr:NAD-dependent epimerase/dehydratase family protein [Capnocytophaga leadbetteri]
MILVTGGTGQIGSRLLLNLTKNKAYKVRAIYRNTQSLEKIRQLFVKHSDSGAAQFDTIEWIQADLSNIPALEKAFEGVTFVFHCAGLISFQPQDFDKLIEVNVQGTANIVNLSIDFGVKKLCYVSSVATLSTLPHTPIDEENDWNNEDNNTDYAISKHGAEMEVWRGSQEGLPVVIVNPSVVLGGDFADRGSGLLYKKVADGLRYYPAGATGFVGVDDVVRAMVQLQFSEVAGERFVLNAENLTYKAVLERIAKQLGVKAPTKCVSHQMLRFLARLDGVLSFLHLKKRTLTLASADALGTVTTYNGEKIKKYIDFNYE